MLKKIAEYTEPFISKQWGKSLGENLSKEHVKIRMNALIDQLTDEKLDEIYYVPSNRLQTLLTSV